MVEDAPQDGYADPEECRPDNLGTGASLEVAIRGGQMSTCGAFVWDNGVMCMGLTAAVMALAGFCIKLMHARISVFQVCPGPACGMLRHGQYQVCHAQLTRRPYTLKHSLRRKDTSNTANAGRLPCRSSSSVQASQLCSLQHCCFACAPKVLQCNFSAHVSTTHCYYAEGYWGQVQCASTMPASSCCRLVMR